MRNGVLKAATLLAKSDDDFGVEPAITVLYNLTVTNGEVFDDLSETLIQDIIHLAMLQENRNKDQGESVKRYAYLFSRALCNLYSFMVITGTNGYGRNYTGPLLPLLELKDDLISKFCIVCIPTFLKYKGNYEGHVFVTGQ